MVLLKIIYVLYIVLNVNVSYSFEKSEIHFEVLNSNPKLNSKVDTKVNIKLKSKLVLKVELALTPDEQQKGLMFRKALEKNSGMLFVFKEELPRSFWMKNTLIPLSIAFIDSKNTIFQISDLNPVKTLAEHRFDSVQSIKPAQYVLEVNKDWFLKNKVSVGDKFFWNESKKFNSTK
jgi:uncharacterized protein